MNSRQRKEANVLHASSPAHLDGSRRDVDRDDVEPKPLRLEAVPSGPATDVENTAVDELEHLLLRGRPIAVFGKEDISGKPGASAAVVELESQLTGVPRQVIEQQTAERVLFMERGSLTASDRSRPCSGDAIMTERRAGRCPCHRTEHR